MIDSIDIQQGKTATVRLRPPSRWTAAITARVLTPDGRQIETPSADLDSVNATVDANAGNSRSQLYLVGSPVIARGRVYQITDTVNGAFNVEVGGYSGGAPRLALFVDPLPFVPDAGSPFQGFEIVITIGVASTANRGFGFRLIAESGDEQALLTFHVVRYPFQFPIEAREIRAYMGRRFGSAPESKNEEWIANLRDIVSMQLRAELLNAQRYPDRVWDRGRLFNAAWFAIKLELAENGFVPKGETPDAYKQRTRFDLRDSISGLLSSISAYDADDDDKLDETERVPVTTRRLRR